VPIAMTAEQQALQAAGGAVNPFFSERTGVRVSNAPVVALLEPVLGPPKQSAAR
jgi:hypothetical protein